MKDHYAPISITTVLAVFFVLILCPTQKINAQANSIRTGVTFNWADNQSTLNDPANLQSININGVDYTTFVVPTSYELTRLGPGGHNQNNIWLNGALTTPGSDNPNWPPEALNAYQSLNLNHYFQSQNTGDNFCGNYAAVTTTNAQIQTITYSPGIPSNPDGVIAITERGGNNCMYIELHGIPSGGGPEQLLGRTFVRNQGNLTGVVPQAPPTTNSDYWSSGRNNENNQVIGIALYELSELAPIGSTITSIRYLGATNDHGDGKFFLMQTYAEDDTIQIKLDREGNGDIAANDMVPTGSTYTLTSGTTNGTLTFNPDGTFNYIPNPGFTGNDTFEYQVCLPAPNTGVCDSGTAIIVIKLEAVFDNLNVAQNSSNNRINVLDNDNFGSSGPQTNGAITNFTLPTNGSTAINDNGTPIDSYDDFFIYTPNNGFIGTDFFTYEITDAGGSTDVAYVYISTAYDTDADSIDDNTDLDDDNDGILDAVEGMDCIDDDYFAWEFNSPSGTRTNDFVQNPSITNWLISGTGDVVTGAGITGISPNSELQLTDIDATTFAEANAQNEYVEVSFTTATGIINPFIERIGMNWYQSTDGTSIGNSYDVAMAISKDNFTTSILLYSDIRIHYPTNGISEFFNLTPAGATFNLEENTTYTLRIYSYNQQNDGNVVYSVFDDFTVRVSACQERNTDGDSIPDHQDLDSDGDGLPDNVEAQTTTGYIVPNGTVDANGIDTAYPSGINPTDTDGAEGPDYLDLDSDNEGGNDTLEAQITLLNTDADNDGLDDATDGDTAGYADPGGTIDDPLSGAIILLDTDKDANSGGDVDFRDAQDDRLDTDTDGIVDAIDLDDDNDGLLDSEELNVILGNMQPDCTGETILDFSTPPSLESGTALQQGAVYRFVNITAGTDALVTIVETFNASVADIDNNTSEAQAFRPRTAFDIANVGKAGYIEYRMQFVNSGGTTPITVPKFLININDTDGNVDYSEEIYVENPASYIISNPTDLSISYEFPWIVATGGTTEYTGAGNTNPQANFGINYENRSEIRFRVGITTIIPAVAASGREHNLDFRCTTNYINPEIYVLDSDKDGYPNPIDLDTDNDGIFDAVEAGHGQSQTNGRVNGSVGADGVPDAVQTDPDNGIVNYTVAESSDDLDGMSDFGDLDSDGDGIPDNVEAQTTIGYTAPNGTVDGNGVDLAYTSGINPINTDGADMPDYLDTDSDNDSRTDLAEALRWVSGADSDSDGLDDRTDEDLTGYSDPGGIIDNPLNAPIILPDVDNDATTGGDVDFRDAQDDRPDNDNDGMPDVVDLDDDNDGILDTDEGCGNLILNASFERDDFTNTATYNNAGANGAYIGADLNTDQILAWDYTQNMDGWVEGGNWAPAYHGIQYMDLIGAATRSGGIMNEFSQVINTIPGNTYTLSLYWGEDYGHLAGTTVDLQIEVIDSSNATIFNDNQTTLAQGPIGGVRGPNTWLYYERTFVATTEQTTIRLTSDAPGPNFYSGANIDFVSVTVANPSSCTDTDNDGVIDAFDLDSDNDGIFDAVEVGHGQPHTNGIVNGAVGTDGVPDAVQTDPDGETVNYVILDSDSDGVDDILDLDADGDGIPDNIEAQTTIGYIAPNGTVDANGVDTAYTAGINPTNTDGADLPDYLDTDSDNEGADDTTEAAIILSGNDTDNDGLDDSIDVTPDYNDVGGTIDYPLSGAVILPDVDNDANAGGDVDFRDATDDTPLDLDADDDGIIDSFEDLNTDGDNNPSTNPTDSDGDSYPDYLDIDSDDDGIPDNVEAQTTAGYIPPSRTDGNANGLDDAYEANGNIGIIPVNTDGTDLPDYLDSDSDNDNVPDNIEGHDLNHDGVSDVTYISSDKDDDGLNDGYEGAEQIDVDVNDEIDDPINDLPNTDGDDESDYRDTDDDDDGIDTVDEDMDQDGNYANDDFDGDGTPDYLDSDLPIEIEEVEVFNVVTPNGDGVHDILTITGLDVRTDNKLRIYSRWGILIYYTESYNTLGNYFDGTSQVRPIGGKENKLPTGTYFYLLEYTDIDGSSKKLSGHLYLN